MTCLQRKTDIGAALFVRGYPSVIPRISNRLEDRLEIDLALTEDLEFTRSEILHVKIVEITRHTADQFAKILKIAFQAARAPARWNRSE